MFQRFKHGKDTKEQRHAGYPERIGLYDVVHEGERKFLMHKVCTMNGRHRWMNVDGSDVIGTVEWIAGPLTPDQMGRVKTEDTSQEGEITSVSDEIMLDESDYAHAKKIDESEN